MFCDQETAARNPSNSGNLHCPHELQGELPAIFSKPRRGDVGPASSPTVDHLPIGHFAARIVDSLAMPNDTRACLPIETEPLRKPSTLQYVPSLQCSHCRHTASRRDANPGT